MIVENFRVPGDAATYVDSLAILYDRLDAPNEEEYTLKPKDVSPESFLEVFNSWPEEGKVREEMTKAIYMMMATDEDWEWGNLVDSIEARLNLIHNEETHGAEIEKEEYAGLVGSLTVLTSRGHVTRDREVLAEKSKSGSLYAALSQSRDHASSGAACVLALLHVGEEIEGKKVGQLTSKPHTRDSKTIDSSSESSSEKNEKRKALKRVKIIRKGY